MLLYYSILCRTVFFFFFSDCALPRETVLQAAFDSSLRLEDDPMEGGIIRLDKGTRTIKIIPEKKEIMGYLKTLIGLHKEEDI